MTCKNLPQIVLSLITTLGFFFTIYFMLRQAFPTENKDIINIMVGFLGGAWTSQMQSFFGSTSSSRDKDETISAIARSAANQTSQPVSIPNATNVKVDTKEGDINITDKTDKTPKL